MSRKKVPYSEGTWFAVPLQNGGYAIGTVARLDGDGVTFGYFFGPKKASVPSESEVARLQCRDAVWTGQFGDLGLLEGRWPIIWHDPSWNRDEWPLPPFVRVDVISGQASKAVYSDDLDFEYEEPCDPELASQYPKDALSGDVAVEIRLTRLLDPSD